MTKTIHTNHKPYLTYYICLSLLLVGQIVYTLYQSSLVVAHGQRQQQLSQQTQQLQKKRQDLSSQLATHSSLRVLSQDEQLAGYQSISQPLVLLASDNLAAAQ